MRLDHLAQTVFNRQLIVSYKTRLYLLLKVSKLLHFDLRDSHPPARALLLMPFIYRGRLKG
nr:MAG TPA: hypothetical protein [Caudoviricetes sp.]